MIKFKNLNQGEFWFFLIYKVNDCNIHQMKLNIETNKSKQNDYENGHNVYK